MKQLVNDTLLFQHILSNSDCAEWLALTAPLTLRYCRRHAIDYQLIMAKRDADPGHWEVPKYIREFLQLGYANVIYLDADTVIVDPETDLREAIVPDTIGAVWFELPDYAIYNAGAFYVSNTPRTRAFVEAWLAQLPGGGMHRFPYTWEQGGFAEAGRQVDAIHRLDNRWNAEPGITTAEHPVVWGLHGYPDRIGPIQHYLKSLEAA
jgi:hypothetical protein